MEYASTMSPAPEHAVSYLSGTPAQRSLNAWAKKKAREFQQALDSREKYGTPSLRTLNAMGEEVSRWHYAVAKMSDATGEVRHLY